MKIFTSANTDDWDELIKLAQQDFGEEVGEEVIGQIPIETTKIEPAEAIPEPSTKPTPMSWDPYAGREKRQEVEKAPEEELWANIQVTLEKKETKYGALTFVILRNTEMPLKDQIQEMGYKAFKNRISGEWTWSKIINKYKSPEIDPQKLETVKQELLSKGVNTASLESAPVEITDKSMLSTLERGVAEKADIKALDVPDELIYWNSEMESAKQLPPSERKKKYSDIIYGALEEVGKKTEADATSKQSQDIVKALLSAASNFHNYSFWNSMMIAIMKPGTAYVASETDWALMGRRLKQGVTRIPIMYPIKGKSLSDVEKEKLSDVEVARVTRTRFGLGSAIAYEDTEPISEDWVSKRGKWKGKGPFVPPQWDIDSNEATEWLTQLYNAAFLWATEAKKFKIETGQTGIAGGWASLGGKITINDKYEGMRKVTTLLHEIAHQLIHFDSDFQRGSSTQQERETDAEATAYVVASHYHIESKNSPIYLAGFGANKGSILGRFNFIRRAAIEMFEGIDETMGRLNIIESKPTGKPMEPNEIATVDSVPQVPVMASTKQCKETEVSILNRKLASSLNKTSIIKTDLITSLKKEAKSYVSQNSITLYLNNRGEYTPDSSLAVEGATGIEANIVYRFYPAEKATKTTPQLFATANILSVTKKDAGENINNYDEEALVKVVIEAETREEEIAKTRYEIASKKAINKKAYISEVTKNLQFNDPSVRTLRGILSNLSETAKVAMAHMDEWLETEENAENLTLEVVKSRLKYYLDDLGIK